MESKRLGLCQKPLFVVPNHLTEQWASEFLRLYPSANILAATKKDFEPRNRKKFCGRIATGDYDAIIIGIASLSVFQFHRKGRSGFFRNRLRKSRKVWKNSKQAVRNALQSSLWSERKKAWKQDFPNCRTTPARTMLSPLNSSVLTISMWTRRTVLRTYSSTRK